MWKHDEQYPIEWNKENWKDDVFNRRGIDSRRVSYLCTNIDDARGFLSLKQPIVYESFEHKLNARAYEKLPKTWKYFRYTVWPGTPLHTLHVALTKFFKWAEDNVDGFYGKFFKHTVGYSTDDLVVKFFHGGDLFRSNGIPTRYNLWRRTLFETANNLFAAQFLAYDPVIREHSSMAEFGRKFLDAIVERLDDLILKEGNMEEAVSIENHAAKQKVLRDKFCQFMHDNGYARVFRLETLPRTWTTDLNFGAEFLSILGVFFGSVKLVVEYMQEVPPSYLKSNWSHFKTYVPYIGQFAEWMVDFQPPQEKLSKLFDYGPLMVYWITNTFALFNRDYHNMDSTLQRKRTLLAHTHNFIRSFDVLVMQRPIPLDRRGWGQTCFVLSVILHASSKSSSLTSRNRDSWDSYDLRKFPNLDGLGMFNQFVNYGRGGVDVLGIFYFNSHVIGDIPWKSFATQAVGIEGLSNFTSAGVSAVIGGASTGVSTVFGGASAGVSAVIGGASTGVSAVIGGASTGVSAVFGGARDMLEGASIYMHDMAYSLQSILYGAADPKGDVMRQCSNLVRIFSVEDSHGRLKLEIGGDELGEVLLYSKNVSKAVFDTFLDAIQRIQVMQSSGEDWNATKWNNLERAFTIKCLKRVKDVELFAPKNVAAASIMTLVRNEPEWVQETRELFMGHGVGFFVHLFRQLVTLPPRTTIDYDNIDEYVRRPAWLMNLAKGENLTVVSDTVHPGVNYHYKVAGSFTDGTLHFPKLAVASLWVVFDDALELFRCSGWVVARMEKRPPPDFHWSRDPPPYSGHFD